MKKIISIAKRIYSPEFKNYNPTECYSLLKSNQFADGGYYKILKPEEIVILSYILPKVESGIDLESLCNEISNNLFCFSFCEIEDMEAEDECSDCNGRGTESCDHCGGSGNETCDNCDGKGIVDCDYCDGSGTDEEGEGCSECGGSGNVDCGDCDGGENSCGWCGGSGDINCSYCDATGYVTLDNKARVSQNMVLSYNKKLMDLLLLKDKYNQMDSEFVNKIYTNNRTLLLSVLTANADIDWSDDLNAGDFFFYELSDDVNLNKQNSGLYITSLYDIN